LSTGNPYLFPYNTLTFSECILQGLPTAGQGHRFVEPSSPFPLPLPRSLSKYPSYESGQIYTSVVNHWHHLMAPSDFLSEECNQLDKRMDPVPFSFPFPNPIPLPVLFPTRVLFLFGGKQRTRPSITNHGIFTGYSQDSPAQIIC